MKRMVVVFLMIFANSGFCLSQNEVVYEKLKSSVESEMMHLIATAGDTLMALDGSGDQQGSKLFIHKKMNSAVMRFFKKLNDVTSAMEAKGQHSGILGCTLDAKSFREDHIRRYLAEYRKASKKNDPDFQKNYVLFLSKVMTKEMVEGVSLFLNNEAYRCFLD